MLTADQIAFFQEHGYLILENFIDSEIIDRWLGTGLEAFRFQPEYARDMAQRLCGPKFQFFATIRAAACHARDYRATWWWTIYRWRRFTTRQMAQS